MSGIKHIVSRHVVKHPGDSFFYRHLSIADIIDVCLDDCDLSFAHRYKTGRTWYFHEFDKNIGRDGATNQPCSWVAVLKQGEHVLVTAFPVTNPSTLL